MIPAGRNAAQQRLAIACWSGKARPLAWPQTRHCRPPGIVSGARIKAYPRCCCVADVIGRVEHPTFAYRRRCIACGLISQTRPSLCIFMTDYLPDRFCDSLDSREVSRHGELLHWHDLDRQARKAMARVLGGGTLRAIAPETVRDLRRLGLIEGDRQSASLTAAGWTLLRSSREWLRPARTRSAG
jgi:hypothetical protein